MKFLNANKVLCLSAHPDDAEYGALGSIIKFNKTQFDVLVLSGGGDFDDTTGYSRLEECQSIWSEIPNLNGSFVKNGFIKDKTEDGWVNYIETNYDMSSYDLILTTPPQDSHFEHRMVNQVAYALIRVSKCGIVTYRAPSTLESWVPNYYVDLSKDTNSSGGIIESAKVKLLKKFESQVDKSYFKDDSIYSFRSNYICSKTGIKFCEQFRIERVFG